jgi:hypothetical protein
VWAIKALIDATDMSLAEAKPIVNRNLNPATQAAAERLWDELAVALSSLANHVDEDAARSNEDS